MRPPLPLELTAVGRFTIEIFKSFAMILFTEVNFLQAKRSIME
jgi:hypothetical protein